MTVTKKKAIPLAIVLACFVIVLAPNMPHSYAHALVIASNPTNGQSLSSTPTSVSATFSDPIDIHYSKIIVLDSNGKEVDNKDNHFTDSNQEVLSVTLPPNLPNGVYTASWKVLDQTDGHVTEGAFVFGVGEAVPEKTTTETNVSIFDVISVPFAIARFPAFLGEVIVVGTTFLSFWIWKPVAKIPWLAQSMPLLRRNIEKNTAKIVLIGAILIIGANFAMIEAEAISINASISDAILTKYGQTWILRMVLSTALVVVTYAWYRKEKYIQKESASTWRWLVFGLGVTVLVTESLISHSAATGLTLPPVLDFVHDVAASFWIGGLIYGAFVVLPALKKSQDHLLRLSVMSYMIPRFTLLIVAILGVVAVTGPTLLYTLETSFSLILASIYGEILIVKLGLAAAMIAMGGYHEIATRSKAFAKLKLIASKKSETQADLAEAKHLESRFHTNILAEALIGIILLASVSVLVDSGLPPTQFQNQIQGLPSVAFATSGISNTFTETGYAQNDTRILLTIDPYYTGSNTLKISFLDSDGNLIPMESARLTYNQVDKGIGPIVENVQPDSQGTFSVDTSTFAIAGHWNLQIEGVQSAANSLNIVGTFNDLYLAPRVDAISASIKEFKLPQNDSRPLFPLYDKLRNVVWVSDAQINSGRIYSFDLTSQTFIEHKLQGINVVTLMALDNIDDTLWYLDPISKLLCNYNPDTNENQIYQVPVQKGAILSGLTIDDNGNIWLSSSSFSNVNEVLRFDPSNKTFTTLPLSPNSAPLGLAFDATTENLWVAESGIGKIAEINPSDNNVTEYPLGNGTLATPTVVLVDPLSGKIFVSEHDGHEVSAFDPILKTFTKYPLDQNQQNLPYGLVFDQNHDLWAAQHTYDKISVINTRTGETNEFSIPANGSLTQYITADSQGDIILIEQGTNDLGILTATSGLPASQVASGKPPFEYPGISLGIVAGPSMAVAIVALSLFYIKSSKDMNETTAVISQVESFKNSTPIK